MGKDSLSFVLNFIGVSSIITSVIVTILGIYIKKQFTKVDLQFLQLICLNKIIMTVWQNVVHP